MTLFTADSTPDEGRDAATDPPGLRRVSLVRLSALVAQATAGIGRIAVEGEVHRVQRGRTGRSWFTLRDRSSQITVSVPAARQSRARVVDGERVCVVGRLEWVNEWGQLQILAEEVTPVGEGAVAAAIAEARARLDADGLLSRARRPIPLLPAAIGVVCGHEAAVRADIESVIAVRFPGYPVVWRQTTVSGPGAVDNIVTGVAELDARAEVEVIILARGGGDATQLLPFSDEAVCRAVCASRTPVVAAIGHEGDRPLVDEVADLRCGTPSIAAAAVIPSWADLTGRLVDLDRRRAAAVAGRVLGAAAVLSRIDPAAAAERTLATAGRRLAGASARLPLLHPAREVRAAESVLEGLRLRAEALSPVRVLERGYAVVRDVRGAVVRDASTVGDGDVLDIEVARGRIGATALAPRAVAGVPDHD